MVCSRGESLTHRFNPMNTKQTVLRLSGFGLALAIIGLPNLAKQIKQQPIHVDASNEVVVSHMADVMCNELKSGTEFRRASVRAGKSARAIGYSKQVLAMVKEETFEEEFALAADNQCSEIFWKSAESYAAHKG